MIKILIVDDEKSICDLIDIHLSTAGYQCKTVQDGLEAIDIIEAENFDLILPVSMNEKHICTMISSEWKSHTITGESFSSAIR